MSVRNLEGRGQEFLADGLSSVFLFWIQTGLQLPILHLGMVNKYVMASMEQSSSWQSTSTWHVPRQCAPSGSQAVATCGVSAFAFQVSNRGPSKLPC